METLETTSFDQLQALRNVLLIARNEYPLKHLAQEKVRHRSRRDDDDEESVLCFCTYPDAVERDEGDVRRCDDVSCLNFATYVECPASCEAGMYCRNQRLQHPERFPQLEPFKTENKGYGVRTKDFIPQLSIVGEYVGEIIDEKELARRLKSVPRQEMNFYYLLLAPGVYIDARNKGSFTRFVNHSCEPNCKTEKWTVEGEDRIAVMAINDIAPGDELTFDYKWKALGSRQITCFCGTTSCKGVIGTQTTSVQTAEAQSGFFRDPEKQETGPFLIGRRVRVFLSPEDKTEYDVQLIKAYDESHDLYEVEDLLEPAGYESDDHESDEASEKQFVRLKENGWQLYCPPGDTNGEVVFAIPKKRLVPSIDASKEVVLKQEVKAQSLPTTGRYENLFCTQRTNEVGEVLDREGKVVSNKLLVKFLPKEYDERMVRSLFISRKHPHALKRADIFHFSDGTGWGLVELESNELAAWFRRTLDRRNLLDKMLRVFPAGAAELDRFRQQKAKIQMMRLAGGTDRSSSSPSREKENVYDKQKSAYCFGRKLMWLVTEDELKKLYVQQKLSASLGETLRVKYVKSIFHIAKGLRLDREDASSAIIALNRYFTFHSMPMDVDMYAATMLHLFLKAHARKVPYTAFVIEVYKAKHGAIAAERLTATSPELNALKRHMVKAEGELLEGLHYDITGEDPYALLDLLTTRKSAKKLIPWPSDFGVQSVPFSVSALPPPEVQKEAKHLVAEVLPLPIWTHTSVECVLLSIVCVSAAVIKALSVPFACQTSRKGPDFLPPLDVQANASEARMLLDCSLSICTLLKERWNRLEKQSKMGSQNPPSSDKATVFDMAQFDRSKDSMDVEMTDRIAQLLKQWIPVATAASALTPSTYSTGPARYHSATRFVPVRASDSSLPPTVTQDNRTNGGLVSAFSIFPKKGIATDSRRDARLHTDAILAVESIRKRAFLGTIATDVRFDVAGKPVYLQSWPYLEHEPFNTKDRGINEACLRELSAATTLSSLCPDRFLQLYGIIFPATPRHDRDASQASATPALELLGTSVEEDGNAGPEGIGRLCRAKHYLAFEQPLHLLSGIFEAHVFLAPDLRKRAIFDMLQSLAAVQEHGYVHRCVAPSHLLVFANGIKLGGYHAMRKVTNLKSKEGERTPLVAYELRDWERKEQCYGAWLYVTAPEVLLGETKYTWRADIWSAGCVALAILLDKVPFLRGQDVKIQLDLIYRLCGTPSMSWKGAQKLPSYSLFRPKHEYKMRLRKTLVEQRAKFPDFPEEAVDVLEAMLQLDPARRSPVKKLLDMSYFDSVRRKRAFDFRGLSATFPVQKKKLVQHLVKSKAKKHRTFHRLASHRHSSDHTRLKRSKLDGTSFTHDKHAHHKSRSDKKPNIVPTSRRDGMRTVPSLNDDVMLHDVMEHVPLPKSFRAGTEEDLKSRASDKSLPRREKRAKLGWGMGLNSEL